MSVTDCVELDQTREAGMNVQNLHNKYPRPVERL